MFHLVSQAGQLILTPTNALTLLLALGILGGVGRSRPSGLTAPAGTLLCTIALLPIGQIMLTTLEDRFPPLSRPPERIAGILVLGGSVSLQPVAGALRPQANQAADRLFTAAELARQAPGAKVVAIGGPIDPSTNKTEADYVGKALQRLGVAPARILLERESADTYENARNAAVLLHPRKEQTWLLVTSAFHTPRAVGAFRKAGFEVIAAPADWRRHAGWREYSWSATANLRDFDTATREALGLLVYYQQGRTGELFPKP